MSRRAGTIAIHNLQRYKIICDILNTTSGNGAPLTQAQILYKLNSRIDTEICASQFQKDLAKLKADFDLEYNANRLGLCLLKPFDFFEALKLRIE